ncbi:MAG: hypothetical protein MUE46_20875 [Xanthomonadales bacterium]|nr:hypothetical protein [Xanthomonadales bacterium]
MAAPEYPAYREDYRYDPAGNVVSMEDAKQRTNLRRYDALGRLREEIGVDGGDDDKDRR